jgi:5'(3')-deoxyribonucleotidase
VPRVYVDMDGVLCDYQGAHDRARIANPDEPWPQSVRGFFQNLAPMPGALAAFAQLRGLPGFDVHILTAASVNNPLSYTEKRFWVEAHIGFDMCKRLILAPDKSLLKGDFLIDDHAAGRGQEGFEGELMHFGSARWPDWPAVLARWI